MYLAGVALKGDETCSFCPPAHTEQCNQMGMENRSGQGGEGSGGLAPHGGTLTTAAKSHWRTTQQARQNPKLGSSLLISSSPVCTPGVLSFIAEDLTFIHNTFLQQLQIMFLKKGSAVLTSLLLTGPVCYVVSSRYYTQWVFGAFSLCWLWPKSGKFSFFNS